MLQNSKLKLPSRVKHCLHCALFLSVILCTQILGYVNWIEVTLDPWSTYGVIVTTTLCILRLLTFLSLPQVIFNFVGLIKYNAFKEKVPLKGSSITAPFICIRVVTRGDYPELVKMNLTLNMNTCVNAQLKNFIFEVVTDKPLSLAKNRLIKETVVPTAYKPKSGTLFKARALQYSLEDKENKYLSDTDWIVHLDEETLLTENCVRGILNFVMDGSHHFGQGLITYANGEVVNWLTTIADNFRVADDMGKLRLQLKYFHKPLFSWKGSFVVSQVGAEKKVSFDNGLDGAVAEDCYFAMKAFQEGYSFNFIEGEMWEKSPFTLTDFIQQRKRWIQGILLVVHSKKLMWRYKILLASSCYGWIMLPLCTGNAIASIFYPIPWPYFLDIIYTFITSVYLYMYSFGMLKSFPLRKLNTFKIFLCMVGVVLAIPINLVVENVAAIWGIFGYKLKFYVVKKDIKNVIIV